MLESTVRSVLLSGPEVGPILKLRRESLLFQQHRDADAAFFIDNGLVKLTRATRSGSEHIVSIIGRNQLAGEECLGSGANQYRSTAECLTEVAAYKVPLFTIRRLFGIPEFASGLVSYTIDRDLQFIHKVEMLAQHDVEHRILDGLAELARLVKPDQEGSAFPIPMTQAEIASYVGATRETTSTTLSQLKSRKLVTLSRRLVTTVHPDILVSAAAERLARVRTASHAQA